MIMNIDFDTVIGLAGVAVGLFGIGYAIGANKKLKDVSEVVGKSVDSMIADGKVDIPKELINETIKEQVSSKVDIEVQRKVKAACDNIVFDVKTSMYNKISDAAEKAVSSTYQSMEVEAKERIRKELRNIDVSALKREVKAEAKDAVAEKLQASMDDILETYNSNLANVQNIYSSIAKSMSARA